MLISTISLDNPRSDLIRSILISFESLIRSNIPYLVLSASDNASIKLSKSIFPYFPISNISASLFFKSSTRGD